MTTEDDVRRFTCLGSEHELLLVIAPAWVVLNEGKLEIDTEVHLDLFLNLGEVVAAPELFRRAGDAADGDADSILGLHRSKSSDQHEREPK